MGAKKRKRGWIIGVAVFATLVTACVLLLNGYKNQQVMTAEDTALRVERALKQIDTDETAKEIRTNLVNEIGEFDEVIEVHSYTHFLPGHAYIHGTVSRNGIRYGVDYFLMNDKIKFSGAIEEIRNDETPTVKEEGTTENSLQDRDR